MPTGSTGQSDARLVIDGGIVATSLFVVFWAIGLDDVFNAKRDSWFAFAVSAAYPLEDLVLLTVALLVLTHARSGPLSSSSRWRSRSWLSPMPSSSFCSPITRMPAAA